MTNESDDSPYNNRDNNQGNESEDVQLEVGDLVELNSGGPVMTLGGKVSDTKYIAGQREDIHICYWFSGEYDTDLQSGEFPLACLTLFTSVRQSD